MHEFIVLPANMTYTSLVLLAYISPQPPFVKGDHLSHSVRGSSNRIPVGRWHKLLVGGQIHYFLYTKQDCAGQ